MGQADEGAFTARLLGVPCRVATRTERKITTFRPPRCLGYPCWCSMIRCGSHALQRGAAQPSSPREPPSAGAQRRSLARRRPGVRTVAARRLDAHAARPRAEHVPAVVARRALRPSRHPRARARDAVRARARAPAARQRAVGHVPRRAAAAVPRARAGARRRASSRRRATRSSPSTAARSRRSACGSGGGARGVRGPPRPPSTRASRTRARGPSAAAPAGLVARGAELGLIGLCGNVLSVWGIARTPAPSRARSCSRPCTPSCRCSPRWTARPRPRAT